jgi:hypothetical protein
MRFGPKKLSRRAAVLAAVLVLGGTAAGIGIAAWNITGSGSGYAKATTASTLTLGDASASTSADLYPGATGSVKLSITNPNAFRIQVTAVTRTGAITSDKGANCNGSTGVAFSDPSGLTHNVDAGATTTITLASAVTMSNASHNDCQGAVFTIPVDVTAISNPS